MVNKKNIATMLGSVIYETVVGKYIYDLHNFMKNDYEREIIYKLSEISVNSRLLPWPYLKTIGYPGMDVTRPLTLSEKIVAYIYQNPVLVGLLFAAPILLYGVKKGVEYYKKRDKK